LIVLFLGLFAMATRNATDPDLWWHLKTGEYIAQHHGVPHSDPFSYTRAGQPWVAHEWLTDLLLYAIDRAAGLGGLIAVFAAVLCAAFFLLYLRCLMDAYVAGLAVLWAAWATMPVWGVRPQVISLLLTSLWLLLLDRSARNPKILWWTLPLTLLWVNLHAGFALGLVLSALYIFGEWIERAMAHDSHGFQNIRFHGFILLLDIMLVPLNPNGARLFFYPIETLRSAAMQKYIAEWASPNFHHAEYLPFLVIVLATIAALAWADKALRARDLVLLVVGLYAGLCSIRMIPLFVFIAAPLICRRIGILSVERPQGLNSQGARPWLNVGIVLAMVLFAIVNLIRIIQREPVAEAQRFPTRAVAFLEAHPPGHLFNHYDWGGYLIWKLYPSTRVFIDGRADVYGEEFLNQFAATYQLKDDWREALQRWKIDTVLVPADSALATGLRSSPGWSVSYEDSQAIILKARPDPQQTIIQAVVQFGPRAGLVEYEISRPAGESAGRRDDSQQKADTDFKLTQYRYP
jgi:hypothetical protein